QDLVVRYEEKVELPYLYALSLGDIQMWQQSASLFVEVVAILPDFLLLPTPMAEAITLEGDSQVPLAICTEATLSMIRLEDGFGTSVASLSLLTTFAPTALTPVVMDIENSDDAALTQWAQKEHISITPPSVLSVVESPQSHALNFLTAPPSRQLSLKPMIGLLILALLLKVSFDVATGYYYQYATTQLVHTSHEQYQAWFGHAPNARTSLKAQAMSYLQHTQAQQVPDAILAQLRQLGGLERVHITQQQDAWQITAQTSLIDTSAAQDALKQLGAQVQTVTHEAGSDLTILIQQPSQ
ncbi:MAG: hypothetical protein Q4C68_06525, partial [Moraxella sp.]|nr:hypothetical protein [Moraxella sp.]